MLDLLVFVLFLFIDIVVWDFISIFFFPSLISNFVFFCFVFSFFFLMGCLPGKGLET